MPCFGNEETVEESVGCSNRLMRNPAFDMG